jgi:type III restriction enzyme
MNSSKIMNNFEKIKTWVQPALSKEKKLLNIKNRLSLREPQKVALDIIADLCEVLKLKKDVDLAQELQTIQQYYPNVKNFEREFVSVALSIATGVGKTRLMGAIITYLFQHKNIRNFFVLAPNLTIYNKLIEDLNNPAHPKYVFKGIADFVNNKPRIITGDNYNQSNFDTNNIKSFNFNNKEICINIFNISKFNKDSKASISSKEKGLSPRIKRISENLGQSYWEYLTQLEDLVVLMDEAHHYHAASAKSALNELKPVLGIELTATPYDEKKQPFKNIVYEYSLAHAFDEGLYVKSPAVATRVSFAPKKYSDDTAVERIKLEDAISCHKSTKQQLELYAQNENKTIVNPFVLVVCKDTTHAKQTFDYISSLQFFNGEYIGKVLQIDSTTKNEDLINQQFLALESQDNKIEIVIHVNMLKEGWDVTNLYTIVPLRIANSMTLIEQTIGRGLRLPYGKRTGVYAVDTLTVLAHEDFTKIITAAQEPNSIFKKFRAIEIDPNAPNLNSTQSATKLESSFQQQQHSIEQIADPVTQQIEQNTLNTKRALFIQLNNSKIISGLTSVDDLKTEVVKQNLLEELEKVSEIKNQQRLFFQSGHEQWVNQLYDEVVNQFIAQTIEIPRLTVQPGNVTAWFEDFDLNVTFCEWLAITDEKLKRTNLINHHTDYIGIEKGAYSYQIPAHQLISKLLNYPEINCDNDSIDLINKLVRQCLNKLRQQTKNENELNQLINYHESYIVEHIYNQMKPYHKVESRGYEISNIMPFSKIEPWNFQFAPSKKIIFYDLSIKKSQIKEYLFYGFQKSCHAEYKFDSDSEKLFAMILETDPAVLKWLRPALGQLKLYWDDQHSKQYIPDFIVELDDIIYICEVKGNNQIETDEVQRKSEVTETYCAEVSKYNITHGKKPWKYLLIPHDKIKLVNDFKYFIRFIKGSFAF